MAPQPKLENIVKKEKKLLSFVPGRWVFRSKQTATVPLGNGQFGQITTPALAYEMGGERNSGSTGRLLDPTVELDREILEAAEKTLRDKPWLGTDERYKLQILGEYSVGLPWNGYDEQSAEQVEAYYMSLPDSARPALEDVMKYELNKLVYDEELDAEVSATNPDKVKVLNDLYKTVAKAQAAETSDTVDLG